MAIIEFKKFEKEGIKTDFQALENSNSTLIPSRTVVKLVAGATTTAGSITTEGAASDVDNKEYFVLAEDCKVGDNGFVYWYIENTDNIY